MDFKMDPWWKTDTYNIEEPMVDLDKVPGIWGPRGPALVPLFKDGTTARGWGRDTFMAKYMRNQFAPVRSLTGYEKGQHAFAWIIRSGSLVCIDIDGKNGGLEHATKLGFLPPTLAETSKSGNGYHLFYLTDEQWDPDEGFNKYQDVIGLVQGVDIRATGCVYHYNTQRWNNRAIANLPKHLSQQLLERQQRRTRATVEITKTLQLDPSEVAIMQYELLEELSKPIKAGSRNQTLFAIGTKLKLAEVPNWDNAIRERGEEVGLDDPEIEKLVSNIENYGV